MKRTWIVVGRLLYVLSIPALALYVMFGKDRTRLVISYRGQVLVVKGWLSNGRWGLPGGGLHKNEEPRLGALRELKEETGIVLDPSQVHFLAKLSSAQPLWRFTMLCYRAELSQQPQAKARYPEIIELSWQPAEELLANRSTGKDAKAVLRAWNARNL